MGIGAYKKSTPPFKFAQKRGERACFLLNPNGAYKRRASPPHNSLFLDELAGAERYISIIFITSAPGMLSHVHIPLLFALVNLRRTIAYTT